MQSAFIDFGVGDWYNTSENLPSKGAIHVFYPA